MRRPAGGKTSPYTSFTNVSRYTVKIRDCFTAFLAGTRLPISESGPLLGRPSTNQSTVKRSFFFILFILFSFSGFAQSNDIRTDSFLVAGNCGMCKKRIEDAAYIKGVKRADWSADTKMLTVVYRPSKTDTTVIQQNLAKAGHEAGLVKANEDAYNSLPGCCHYRTETCNH